MGKRGVVVGVLVAVAAAALPLGAAGAGAPEKTRKPLEVEVTTRTFVDDSRPTPASQTQPAADARTLVTDLYVPAGTAKPRPIVVLAHGLGGNPGKFTELLGAWASAGYVVAAPLFPRSSDIGGRLVADVAQQPGDVSFVIDEVLRLARTKGSPLRGRVDPEHIGLAGMSLGGWTTYGVAFHPCCREDRIDAFIAMSALRGGFDGGEYAFTSRPILLVHGDADPLYPQSIDTYPLLASPKWFATLAGAGHAEPYEDAPSPSDAIVREITVDFWDRWLRGDRAAIKRLVATIDASGGAATLQTSEPSPAPPATGSR